jgi:mannose-6-phosphate isomerase-like protein (cupin superfamily)
MRRHLAAAPYFLTAGLLLALVTGSSAAADEHEAFIVLPDTAAPLAGSKGREADVTELFATSAQTGGSLGLFRQTISPKSGPPLHIHKSNDEFFYVISGEFRFQLGARVVSAPVGSFIFVPRGTAHTFENSGTVPGVLLVGVTPGGLENFFVERQGVDAATADSINKRYDTDSCGPPLR